MIHHTGSQYKSANNNSSSTFNFNPTNNSNSNFNFDMATMLKLKTIMDSMNKKDDPRSNLLLSLKPFLKESRRKKVDQYVNLFNMSKIMDVLKESGGGGLL